MPERFGHIVCSLATIIVAFSFVGCRTTASKLASVPGMSWLERGDEGWANFEPAPGLPRPSATSEPTTEGSKSTANIASKSESGSGTRAPFGGSSSPEATSVASKPRFDTARYMSNNSSSKGSSTRSNTASTYGDYASAYGKYGAPKSLKDDSKIATQKGPYDVDVPKYDAGGFSGSTSGYDLGDKYSNPSKPTANAAKGSSSYAFDNSASSLDTTPKATYIANAKSRFGGATTNSDNASQASTYTPPGFVKSAATKLNSGSRFSGMAKPSEAIKSPSSYANTVQNGLSTAAPGNSSRGQIVNQFSSAARETAAGLVGIAGQNAQTTAQNVTDQANQTFNRYAQSATQTFNNATNSANGQFKAAAKYTIDNAPANFGGPTDETSKFPKDAVNRFGGATQNVTQATAQTFPQQVNSQARDAVQDYATAAKGVDRNVTQNVSPSAQNSYPSTNTPNPFMVPISPVMQNQKPAPTEKFNSTPPSYSVPETPPAIQRSTAPYRPGSTSTYQGAVTTRKPTTENARNTSNRAGIDNQLVLAVGDKYQFPRTLR